MIRIQLSTEREKDIILNLLANANLTEGTTIISVEDNINAYYDNIVQLEIRSDLGFNVWEAYRQAMRHAPSVVVVEDKNRKICWKEVAKEKI